MGHHGSVKGEVSLCIPTACTVPSAAARLGTELQGHAHCGHPSAVALA